MDTTEQIYKGKISFVNYEKHFASIDYRDNNKQKSVYCKTDAADSSKKPHHYRVGDEVSFQLKLSDRGDKMTAYNVNYRHNEAISLLMQKLAIENKFAGFLKKIDDNYFVKECDSYIFFPLQLSPWEIPPAEKAANEVIYFSFINPEKPNALKAELFSRHFIPEFKKAMWHLDQKKDVEAVVYKITPHALHINLFDNKIQTKLTLTPDEKALLKEGDKISVSITHLSPARIVVKKA